MSKLITCIWFANNNGEEAANYYIDTFNSAPGDHKAKMEEELSKMKGAIFHPTAEQEKYFQGHLTI